MNERIQEITNELNDIPVDHDGGVSASSLSYCGPIASHIVRLEDRITELEAKIESSEDSALEAFEQLKARIVELEKAPVPDAKIQVGAASIDTRPGLSVSDVIELSRALRSE